VVAVTGSTGLVGRHVCDHFRRRGWEVRALGRDFSDPPFTEDGITFHRCDLPEELDEEALAEARAVIHCAWATRATDPERARNVNVEGTRRVLEAARARNVERFVLVSSFAAGRPAASGYGRAKKDAEDLLDPRRDLAVRPGLVLAEGAGLYDRIRRLVERFPVVPVVGGDRPVQIVHVDDLCRAFERALERDLTGTLSVAHPDPVPFSELLARIAESLGRRPLLVDVPAGPVIAGLRLAEGLGLRLPVRSDNLRGLLAQEPVETEGDLDRIGIALRPLEEAVAGRAPS
jgi:NADH dehydrogenase